MSPTSAVSPPEDDILISFSLRSEIISLFPSIISEMTSPGIRCLFLPIVDDITKLSVTPTAIKSSIFIINASWAIPLQTDISFVSFQYK